MAAALTLSVSPQRHGGSRLGGELDLRKMKTRGATRKDLMDDVSLTPSSEDPLRILAPGQKKLSTIESQRVLAVIEEVIKRLDCATLVPVLSQSLDRFAVSLGQELVKNLDTYNHLTEDYNKLYLELEAQGLLPDLSEFGKSSDAFLPMEEASPGGSRTSLTSSSRPSRPVHLEPLELGEGEASAASTERRFLLVRARLKHSVKCILRELHRNPIPASAQGVMKSWQGVGEGTSSRTITLLQDEMR